MRVELLGFPTTEGLPRKARQHGPEVLRSVGIARRIADLGAAVSDLGDLAVPEGRRDRPVPEQVAAVVASARRQADFWQAHHRPGDLMLTLGGDHITSLGSIWALKEQGHQFDVIWIDAHGDFNTLETSPSGHPHGMVLALACGLMPEYLGRLVDPADLRLWGIRDLDPGEQALLVREQVEVLSPDQLRHQCDRVLRQLKPDVFISFDIDGVDPAEAPGTLTPVPGGLHRFEVLDLIAAIARERRILGLDIVEYHPDRDRHLATAELAVQAAECAFGRGARNYRPGFVAAAGA